MNPGIQIVDLGYEARSGWGEIYKHLSSLGGSGTPEVALHMGMPDAVKEPIPGKINILLTVTDSHIGDYPYPFAKICNQMDGVIVVSNQQQRCLEGGGVTVPVRQATLGHDHAAWFHPIRERKGEHLFMFDRGRDNEGSVSITSQYYDEITLVQSGYGGAFTDKELREAYSSADVFFKWSQEAWCFPILQAMSAGCLVITDCTNLPYLVDHENCLLVRSIEELRATLHKSKDEILRQIKYGGQMTAESLTWEKSRSAMRQAIRELAMETGRT